jgi:hypothetical protein
MRLVRRAAPIVGVTFVLFAGATNAWAQAWVPPAGVGAVTFIYQTINNTGHLLTDGSRLDDGKSTDIGLYVEGEYALTDRFSLAAGVPYVFARYRGPGPTPFVTLPIDACHCWNHGLSDFSLRARYNIANGAFALTPSVVVGAPSHAYAYRGEAVVGRGLREIKFAVDAGQRLDRISPKLAMQGSYSYAVVERVLDLPNNRSNVSLQGNYEISRRLSAHGVLSWQRTHGGLRLGAGPGSGLPLPGEVNTLERQIQHDRLLRDNNFRAGFGASYSFPRLDVFGSYTEYVRGTDTHDGHVFTAGMTVPFERAIKRH